MWETAPLPWPLLQGHRVWPPQPHGPLIAGAGVTEAETVEVGVVARAPRTLGEVERREASGTQHPHARRAGLHGKCSEDTPR